MSPCGEIAVAQIALDGVVATSLKAGASCRNPSLEMATPCAVPLRKSSYFDCSQVRVPSAKPAAAAERRMRNIAELRNKMVASEGEKSLNPEYHGKSSS